MGSTRSSAANPLRAKAAAYYRGESNRSHAAASRIAAGSGVWTLLYTSAAAPTYPLLLDTSIYTAGASLQNVEFGAGTCP